VVRRVSVIRRLRTKFMPSSNFRRPRAVRDSSRFLSLLVVATVGVGAVEAVEAVEAMAAVVVAAGRRVRWSSLFGAGDSLGREVVEVVVVVPAKPAALRVP